MKTTRRAFLTSAAFVPAFAKGLMAASRQSGGERLFYVGTYTNDNTGSKGIYAWRFNPTRGTVTSLGVAAETDSPSWLALHPTRKFLFAANEAPPADAGGPTGAVTSFAVDAATGKLRQINRVKTKGLSPAHMLVDPTGKWAIVGNYGSGNGSEGTSVAVFGIRADGRLTDEPKTLVPHTPPAHPHHVVLSPDARFLLVTDLGQNRVVVYTWDAATGGLTPSTPPFADAPRPALGPRHLAFGKGGRFVYVCNELARSVTTYRYDAARGVLSPLDTLSTLPAGALQTGSTAEIEVHPDSNYLYVSNRGHDSLALFAIDSVKGTLTPTGHFPVGGTPRNFKIDPTGNYVFGEGQNNGVTVVFKIDRPTGMLTKTDVTLDSPAPVCIVFV